MDSFIEKFQSFEPYCWYGIGWCQTPPDQEVPKEAKDDETGIGSTIANYFLLKPAYATLKFMDLEFKPNVDNLLVLILAIIISTVTALIVAGCWFTRGRHIEDRDAAPETPLPPQLPPVFEPLTCPILPSPDDDPEDKPAVSPEASNPIDINNNNACDLNSGNSSILRSWNGLPSLWNCFERTENNTNNPNLPLGMGPNLSIPEIRNGAKIERVPSTQIGQRKPQAPFKPPKRVTIRSLSNLLKDTTDPILVLHQIPQKVVCQNILSLKLETILRLCSIPHLVVAESEVGSTKGPWLSYAGKDYFGMDSCYELLKESYPIAYTSCQIPPEKLIPARYIKILAEYHLHWALLYWRAYHGISGISESSINFDCTEFSSAVEKEDNGYKGYMFKCYEEFKGMNIDQMILEIDKDFESLSVSLGNKEYFIGYSMSALDCAIFAVLAQFMWPDPSQLILKRIIQKYGGLVRYCNSIRDNLWPDWEGDVLSSNLSSQVNLEQVNFVVTDDSQYGLVSEPKDIMEVQESGTGLLSTLSRMMYTRQAPPREHTQSQASYLTPPSGAPTRLIAPCNS